MADLANRQVTVSWAERLTFRHLCGLIGSGATSIVLDGDIVAATAYAGCFATLVHTGVGRLHVCGSVPRDTRLAKMRYTVGRGIPVRLPRRFTEPGLLVYDIQVALGSTTNDTVFVAADPDLQRHNGIVSIRDLAPASCASVCAVLTGHPSETRGWIVAAISLSHTEAYVLMEDTIYLDNALDRL